MTPVTADLLRRYDRPGPRYTSYPTAVEFTEEVGAGVDGGVDTTNAAYQN
ncbi:MAG: hypothetical protein HC853_19525 [Anaerolineae bacterium]|nr:hypothetical protein [Anaerolineae bacterium]